MPRPPILPLPHPHYMALAPLDCWLRVLLGPPALVSPRYWLRLGFALFTSSLSTVATLPERLALWPLLRARFARTGGVLRRAPLSEGRPDAVVVLGYFRSGTTHLHYLLSCDPRLRTPTWAEALAPQGWAATWLFLRVFMIPFLGGTRPQDDVAIGPDWPAEDDFACNNWNATSSLVSRFVLPSRFGLYARYHALDRLSPGELRRWRFAQWAFLQKLAWLSPSRTILLKSPSHTARVAELRRMLGPGVRFVHISRDPAAVIRSNVKMAQRLGVFNLEDPPGDEGVRARVVEEYLASEEKYLAESAGLPPGSLVEVRYEDLVADPMGTLRRVYDGLGLGWTPEADRRVRAYLSTVREYKAANERDARAAEDAGDPAERRRIAALIARFGHDRPAVPAQRPEPVDLGGSRRRRRLAAGVAAGIAAVGVVLWCAQAWFTHNRHDWLAWPLGVAIGLAAIRLAREGSWRLGVWCGVLVFLAYAAAAYPATFLSGYGPRPDHLAKPGEPTAFWNLSPWVTFDRWHWWHIRKSAWVGATATNNAFWMFMGVVTAFRFASRRHVTPPGRG